MGTAAAKRRGQREKQIRCHSLPSTVRRDTGVHIDARIGHQLVDEPLRKRQRTRGHRAGCDWRRTNRPQPSGRPADTAAEQTSKGELRPCCVAAKPLRSAVAKLGGLSSPRSPAPCSSTTSGQGPLPVGQEQAVGQNRTIGGRESPGFKAVQQIWGRDRHGDQTIHVTEKAGPAIRNDHSASRRSRGPAAVVKQIGERHRATAAVSKRQDDIDAAQIGWVAHLDAQRDLRAAEKATVQRERVKHSPRALATVRGSRKMADR